MKSIIVSALILVSAVSKKRQQRGSRIMRIRQICFLVMSTVCLSGVSGTVFAQDDGDDGHIYTVSTYKWPFNNLEEIFAFMEENQDILNENEFVLSRKVLAHRWGDEFSVMIIREYASMADIDKAAERGAELRRAKYSDEAARTARGERGRALRGTAMHNDNILQEIPALTK